MNQEERAKNLFDSFWQGIKDLFKPQQLTQQTERAISRQMLQEKLDKIRGSFSQRFNNDNNWSNWVMDASDEFIVADMSGTKFRISYQEIDGNIIFAPQNEWQEVEISYIERAMSMSRLYQVVMDKLMETGSEETRDSYPVDLYADDGQLYLLCSGAGKIYRHTVTLSSEDITLGERVQVMESHPPIATRTVVRQQADGRYRWFSVSGTAVLNRSGEIDSRDLFDSFVRHAEETGIYPIRMFYHQGQVSRGGEPDEQARLFRTGQADFLARDGYCYVTSGLFDDTPLAQAEVKARQANPEFWGDSIGFWPWDLARPYELTEIANGISIPMYRDGINVEITTLPETEASHLFTRMEVTRMELQGKTWEAFLALWGGDEEKARQWLEANPQARNRTIEESGMITRTEGEADTPQEIEIGDEVITAVIQAVVESETVKRLTAKLTEAEGQLTQRAKETDDLKAVIASLVTRLEKLESKQAVATQQAEDDTPAKLKTQIRVVHRPRLANAAIEENGVAYNEKANANMPKGAY